MDAGLSLISYVKKPEYTDVKNPSVQPNCKIYPNPAINAFQLTGIEGTATITLTDVSGRLLLSKDVTTNETVSVSTLPNGIYLAAIKSNNTKKTEKLIIQR